jgi:hypothetical protein
VTSAVLALAACGTGAADVVAGPAGPVPAASTTSPEPEPLDPRGVLAATRDSVAMVETPASGGSAVLLDDGYLVTNAHVVDPFRSVDIVFEGGERYARVPVVGIDATSDIAVIGPVTTDRPALALEARELPAQGDTVYLVGYPGEIEDEPLVTISRGVVSRIRSEPAWDHTYLQTDASIAGGQSGGALVSETGAILGISGLTFTSSFALALSSGDVEASMTAIRDAAGRGDATGLDDLPLGDAGDATTLTVDLDEGDGVRTVGFPARDGERTVELRGRPEEHPTLLAYTLDGSLTLETEPPEGWEGDDQWVPGPDAVLPEIRPGVYELTIPDGAYVLVDVASWDAPTDTVRLDASEPFLVVPDDAADGWPLDLDDPMGGTLGFANATDTYRVELAAGDVLVLTMSCPGAGDAAIGVLDADGAELAYFDDDGGGLYGTDSSGRFVAPDDGTYEVVAQQAFESVVTAYRLTAALG